MAKSTELSDKQKEILEYIKEALLNRGYPPTVREICEKVHLKSTSSVHAHLGALEKKGYIRRDPSKPRAIEIVDEDFSLPHRDIVSIPLIGTVAAGLPMPAEMLPNKQVFMLKVKGDSMVDVGIYSGDSVIVEQEDTATNGEIVVALVDDSATVKRFYKEKNFYRLQPENTTMPPIIVDHVKILGKVIGLIRMMH